MKKALIKETGEIFDVRQTYKKMWMSFEINFSDVLKTDEVKEETWTKSSVSNEAEGTYYILSDDNKYFEEELVVGMDNIRDWKIKNII